MARISLDNPQYFLNRDTSWLAFNRRVLEEAEDEGNPLLERLKFLSISASNLDEFFEVRVAAMMQQIEDGYNEAGPDGLTLTAKRDVLNDLTHEFVDDQYDCWNARLRPALSENGIRVLGMHELDSEALRFVDEYCEKELDPLLTPVTVDPAHPFPRVINKALCLGFFCAGAGVPRSPTPEWSRFRGLFPGWFGCRRTARVISFFSRTSLPIMRCACITVMTWFLPHPFA